MALLRAWAKRIIVVGFLVFLEEKFETVSRRNLLGWLETDNDIPLSLQMGIDGKSYLIASESPIVI